MCSCARLSRKQATRPPREMAATVTPHSELKLELEGMTCASCASRIERKLNKLEGVEASVNLATERARVAFDPGLVTEDMLVDAVEQVGYQATLPPAPGPTATPAPAAADAAPTRPLRRRLLGSVALGTPVLALAMVPAWQFDGWQWLSLQLGPPVVWGGGRGVRRG